MNKGFQQACLDVKHIVEKTMEEATAHDQELTWATTEGLNLWTAALRLVLEYEGVPAAEMKEWQAYTQQTGLLISRHILEQSQKVTQVEAADGRIVWSTIMKSFDQA